MANAARAIIIENNKMLVMHRNKNGSTYFTLVGGKQNNNETLEQTLAREVEEETGLQVTGSTLVFIEEHADPYNNQYIFICTIAPHAGVGLQSTSEESLMNKVSSNLHDPRWVDLATFSKLPFLTVQLQEAIVNAFTKDFPAAPVQLNAAVPVKKPSVRSRISKRLPGRS